MKKIPGNIWSKIYFSYLLLELELKLDLELARSVELGAQLERELPPDPIEHLAPRN